MFLTSCCWGFSDYHGIRKTLSSEFSMLLIVAISALTEAFANHKFRFIFLNQSIFIAKTLSNSERFAHSCCGPFQCIISQILFRFNKCSEFLKKFEGVEFSVHGLLKIQQFGSFVFVLNIVVSSLLNR